MQPKIKIIIADDHNLFIEGLLLLLKDVKYIEITAVANNAKELFELIEKSAPHLILLDINMPGMSGLDAIKYIKHYHPDVKIIMLSTYNEEHLIEKSKSYGANGYLLKNTNKEELTETICAIHNGESFFPLKQQGNQNAFSNTDPFLVQFNLTKREKELLQLIKKGHTNNQIANDLHLSIYTVETHRKNIMQKLNLRNPVELMKFILQNSI